MNFVLQMVAKFLLKGMGPIDGAKTWIGLAIAIAGFAAERYGVQIPVLGNEMTEFLGTVLAGFGLGHKGGKALAG